MKKYVTFLVRVSGTSSVCFHKIQISAFSLQQEKQMASDDEDPPVGREKPSDNKQVL